MLLIDEIQEKSPEGTTGPYYCRADDGDYFWVKGKNCTRQDIVYEWICANLARLFGLPVADFHFVSIPDDLYEILPKEFRDIGYGVAFGSRNVSGAAWYEAHSNRGLVDQELARDILFFDYWIQNMDRSFGNANLLVDPKDSAIRVIDHNLAFDKDFSKEDFLKYHVFRDSNSMIFNDFDVRARISEKLDKVMESLDSIIEEIPEEWGWIDLEQTIEANIEYSAVSAILKRYREEKFWML